MSDRTHRHISDEVAEKRFHMAASADPDNDLYWVDGIWQRWVENHTGWVASRNQP